MIELLKTTNPVELSAAQAFLSSEDIEFFVFDVHMSIMEGSIGIFPKRLMVRDEDAFMARSILRNAGIELPDDES